MICGYANAVYVPISRGTFDSNGNSAHQGDICYVDGPSIHSLDRARLANIIQLLVNCVTVNLYNPTTTILE